MEAVHQQVAARFAAARQLLEDLERLLGADAAAEPRRELEAADSRFRLACMPFLLQAAMGETRRLECGGDFARAVKGGDFDEALDRVQAGIARQLDEASGPPPAGRRRGGLAPELKPAVARLRDQLRRLAAGRAALNGGSSVPQWVPIEDYSRCAACGVEMTTYADCSELRCGICTSVRPLEGTVFGASQFYSQDGQKAKSGTFNPNRHYQSWIVRIQAREPKEEIGDSADGADSCGEVLLASLRRLALRRRCNVRRVDMGTTRRLLKALKRTDLNKNAALIMRELSGVGPPALPHHILARGEMIFNEVIQVREEVVGPAAHGSRRNRSYYPYYIYKILDSILDEGDFENRRILYYIHLQGDETLASNDAEWYAICDHMGRPEWKRATDRKYTERFRPE